MNWEILGSTGEWAGAIAVVATLAYLVKQVRVNARQLERQVQSNIDDILFRAYDPIYEGRNSEIFFHGLHEPEKLSGPDSFIFDLLMRRQTSAIGNIAQLYEQREISRELMEAYADHYRKVFLSTSGGLSWFQDNLADVQSYVTTLGLESDVANGSRESQ